MTIEEYEKALTRVEFLMQGDSNAVEAELTELIEDIIAYERYKYQTIYYSVGEPTPSGTCLEPKKTYANYLQHQDQYSLNLACVPFAKASTYGVFLVGSCLRTSTFRDVDVRCMLPDDQYKSIEPFVAALNASVSEWFRQRTGLPVDFQFQDFTETNKKHDGQRSALGIL